MNELWEELKPHLNEGMNTTMIYRWVSQYLREHSEGLAARYSLKKAIMEMGPSGYPFEKLVSKVLEKEGFKTQTSQVLNGICVNHEVDVVAKKDNRIQYIECKYHNKRDVNCDVKVPLYIHSRFNDLVAFARHQGIHNEMESWIYTNTGFTEDAIQYATCSKLHLVAWNYPKNNGLNDRLDRLKIYPITCLTTISSDEKALLMGKDIILVQELLSNMRVLRNFSLTQERRHRIMNECLHLTEENHGKK